MSAAVCGSKRSFFEDQSPPLAQRLPPSPVLTKRQRRSSSTSPIRFAAPYLLEQLRSLFPHMDPQVLERALEECGNDMDAAIKRLHELCLGSAEETSASAEQTADTIANGMMNYTNEDGYYELEEENEGLLRRGIVEGCHGIDGIADKFQCMSIHKRDAAKRGEELSLQKKCLWKQEQKGRVARLEKQLRIRWELGELIEEQLNRFHAHYNLEMVPTRLKDVAQLLMPNWTPPDELISTAWLGDWRPSAILELVRSLPICSCSSSSCSSNSSGTEQLLSQLIYEIRIEEAIIDEEMAEIQSTCIFYLPFAPANIQSGGAALASVQSEFKKIERVITKAQQLRFRALELVLKKVLNQTDAAEFLVAFEGIQEAIHQFAANQRFQKGPVTVPVKSLGSS